MTDRISQLQNLIADKSEAILITSDVNRRYFTSFKSSAGVVLVTQDSATLMVDFRYYESACKFVTDTIKVVCYSVVFDAINNILEKEQINTVIIEDKNMTVNQLVSYKKELKAEICTDYSLSDKILDLRVIKTDSEIECSKKAQLIAEKSFIELLNIIQPGVTEKTLAVELEYYMKKYGAEASAFDIIAVSGKNSSLPHGVPTDKEICEGEFITFDFGAVVDGYHSDMTRTVAVSYATDEMKHVYNTVLSAHKKAAAVIKSGALCSDVDNAARDYIISKGFGEYFGHSTGHGVGLEIHEKPTVYKTNQSILKENTIITVEPGIYIPDSFGVRIEDMYLTTKTGFEDLATIDKELIIL